MKQSLIILLAAAAFFGFVPGAPAQTVVTGPSSSDGPFVIPISPGYTITSILTASNSSGGYSLCGLPDGMGALDNNNGNFSLFVNHEFTGAGYGSSHAHGADGAFVSRWTVDKNSLAVLNGTDQIVNLNLWNTSVPAYTLYNGSNPSPSAALARFCSADLPPLSAFYNFFTGKGTQARIFMNGEENGNEGRSFAHIVTGPNAGTSYELPYLGKYSCENQLANPSWGDLTIVAGMDDQTPGQVYIYVGTKTNTGSEIERAGLTGGSVYGIAVSGYLNESNAVIPSANTTFSLINLGVVSTITGATLNLASNNLGVTNFLRPEDGAWDPSNPTDFYFNTTNSFGSPSRLWRLRFSDITNPQLGGTITAVLDGTEGQQMLDNITIDNSGHILLTEDVGNDPWLGRILEYNIATDVLTPIAQHDPQRFLSSGTGYLTQDEEASGIFDAQAVLGPGKFLFGSQANYVLPSPLLFGGQLMVLHSQNTATSSPELDVQGNGVNVPAGSVITSQANNTFFGISNTVNSISKTFVIKNNGPGPLSISYVGFGPSFSSEFNILNSVPGPFTISPNGSYSLNVLFSPIVPGTYSSTVYILSNDSDEPFYAFAIEGIAANGEINVQGNNINIQNGSTNVTPADNTDFGFVASTAALTRSFEIQNTGMGTLVIYSMSIAGVNAPEFSLANLPPLFPATVSANSSMSFAVKFSPSGSGVFNAKVVISNSDTDESNYNFAVRGTGFNDVGMAAAEKTPVLLKLFPNPAKDAVTVWFILQHAGAVEISIFDTQGKKVYESVTKELPATQHNLTISTSELKSGVYFVQLLAGDANEKLKLIIKH